jgi:hypothetical protein
MRRLLLTLTISLGIVAVPQHGAFAQQPNSPLGGSEAGSSKVTVSPSPVPPVLAASQSGSVGAGPKTEQSWFFKRLLNAYVEEFEETAESEPELPRRALPSPWDSPPFPGSDYQGYPLIGVPYSTKQWPLMKALSGNWLGDAMNASRIKAYGWAVGSGNWSSAKKSNLPTSYWIVPNRLVLDQALFRLERELDSVQTDQIDVGFRSTVMYGTDYRFTTAGGWLSDQLLRRNRLYGVDPTGQYADVYIPWVTQGMIVRVGRWIACPDIETQWAPDNYLGSHSILFTYDTYTQTGVMLTNKLNDQWTVQGAIHAGTDMAPWYKGATPTGAFGVRWVSKDNNDAHYLWLNAINNAKFRDFKFKGQPAGHDNYNYVVDTWEHRFNKEIHTKTEGYFMWQRDALVGGTPSIGPVRRFGGGGGAGKLLKGLSLTYGLLNYTMFQTSKRDYITLRNEWWKDERGMRAGFRGNYTSHTIGWSHQFNDVVMIRPEVGYYRDWTKKAFDLGKRNGIALGGFDVIFRF